MNKNAALSAQLNDDSPVEDIKVYRAEFDDCILELRAKLQIQPASQHFLYRAFDNFDDADGNCRRLRRNAQHQIQSENLGGILGAAAVAVQTAARQFPVEVGSKRYLESGNSIRELLLELSLVEDISDLRTIKTKYVELLKHENAIP